MRVFYFGCYQRSGHFFWSPGMRNDWHAEKAIPWEHVDGVLCPGSTGDPNRPTWEMKRPQVQGEAALHRKDGWTALAFWDRSVDERGGCNSMLFAEGTHSFEEMVSPPRPLVRNPNGYGKRPKNCICLDGKCRAHTEPPRPKADIQRPHSLGGTARIEPGGGG